MRFWLIYAALLATSIAAVQVAAANLAPPPPPPDEAPVAYIALPPKPEGSPKASGAGEGPLYTEAICEGYGGDFRDACFNALALQRAERDPAGALEACRAIAAEDTRLECTGDIAGLHWPVDRAVAEAICPEIPRKKWRDQCWFNVALAASASDFAYARGTCAKAGMWRDFCYHDVNGEIAQRDPDDALAWCDREQGELLRRKTCYHGLGKYLGRVDPPLARATCDKVPAHEPLYPENCHHGVGWAMAETRGAAALSACPLAGAYADSCVLGISAYAKRLDPAEALAICAGVQRADLRQRCEAFASR